MTTTNPMSTEMAMEIEKETEICSEPSITRKLSKQLAKTSEWVYFQTLFHRGVESKHFFVQRQKKKKIN